MKAVKGGLIQRSSATMSTLAAMQMASSPSDQRTSRFKNDRCFDTR